MDCLLDNIITYSTEI